MLGDISRFLVCPHCQSDLMLEGRVMQCTHGHSFDVARQGYVSLLSSNAQKKNFDVAAMVAARNNFLQAGHYSFLVDSLVKHAEELVSALAGYGTIVDVGGGTGYYLAAVLDRLTQYTGILLDTSKYALRRSARAHPRLGAIMADTWHPLPIRHEAAVLVLNVFAPRNGTEFRRILRDDGALIVVTPTTRHLKELVEKIGLLSVDERKEERLAVQLGPYFELHTADKHEKLMQLARKDIASLAAMGPSAWHTDARSLQHNIDQLPEPFEVTASVTLSVCRPL